MRTTIVLFGASGFLGRNLLAAFAGAGHEVHGVSRTGAPLAGAASMTAMANLDRVPRLPEDAIAVTVAAHRYDAANFATGQSDILLNNVNISAQVYRFCIERGVMEVRAAGSVAVYPANLDVMDDAMPVDFNAAPHAREAFYAWSKRWGEVLAGLYAAHAGISTLTFRLSNPYGPHDSTDMARAHVLPAFIMKALSEAPEFEILGDPKASRDFVFVSDVCDVFLKSLSWRGETAAYNLCTGEQTRLIDLAEEIMTVTGRIKPICSRGAGPNGVARRVSKAERMKAAFGIEAFTPLNEGLTRTIGWYAHALER